MNNETLLFKIVAILKKYTTIPTLLKKTYMHFNDVKITSYSQLETTLQTFTTECGIENKQLEHLFYITIKPLIIQEILDTLNSLKNKYKKYDNIENDILFNVHDKFGTNDIQQYLNKLYDTYIKTYLSSRGRYVIKNMFLFIDREIIWAKTQQKEEYYEYIYSQVYRTYRYDNIKENDIINTIKHNIKNIINIYT